MDMLVGLTIGAAVGVMVSVFVGIRLQIRLADENKELRILNVDLLSKLAVLKGMREGDKNG